jgi:hypothetical protein
MASEQTAQIELDGNGLTPILADAWKKLQTVREDVLAKRATMMDHVKKYPELFDSKLNAFYNLVSRGGEHMKMEDVLDAMRIIARLETGVLTQAKAGKLIQRKIYDIMTTSNHVPLKAVPKMDEYFAGDEYKVWNTTSANIRRE